MTRNARRRFKRCIVHIGTEKTGTTAIQTHLRSNHHAYLREGILYPGAAGRDRDSQWEFAACVHPAPWKQDMGRALGIEDAAGQTAFTEAFRKALDAEFETHSRADTLVISSEHFQSRLATEKMVAKLKAFLEPWVERFEIVVYFRRQDRLALSLQSTRLKSSAQLPHDDILKAWKATPAYYAYDQLYQRWQAVFGADAMRPRLYTPERRSDGDIVADFCRLCDLPAPREPSKPMNVSLNRKGFHFLQQLNKQFPAEGGYLSDPIRAALVQEISAAFQGDYFPISRQQAIDFYRQFEDVNERLRKLAFPDQPSPLFDEDFSAYPEQAEPLTPQYSDAVEICMTLWRSMHARQPRPTPSAPLRLLRKLKPRS